MDAGNLINGDRILFARVKRLRASVKLPAGSALVEIAPGDELVLIGYCIDALPTVSQALQPTVAGAMCGRLRRFGRRSSTSHLAVSMLSFGGRLTMQ